MAFSGLDCNVFIQEANSIKRPQKSLLFSLETYIIKRVFFWRTNVLTTFKISSKLLYSQLCFKILLQKNMSVVLQNPEQNLVFIIQCNDQTFLNLGKPEAGRGEVPFSKRASQ